MVSNLLNLLNLQLKDNLPKTNKAIGRALMKSNNDKIPAKGAKRNQTTNTNVKPNKCKTK